LITIEIIASRHNEWRKMALYLGATDDNVNDIVQELYIKLIEIETNEGDLKRITGDNGKLHTMYIFKILQSKVIDEFRRQKKETFEQFETENDIIELEEVDTYSILMNEIRKCIDEMREYDQMLLELYFVYGFSFREIQKRTSIPTRSVFNIVKNAKIIIKEKTQHIYEQYCQEENDKATFTRLGGFYRENNESNED